MNYAFINDIHVREQMKRTFYKHNEIKRRNPNKYIKNPTKVFYTTLGNKDYAFQDTAKRNIIAEHGNGMDKIRNEYREKVPIAP